MSRRASQTAGPIDSGGTKWPSITSMCTISRTRPAHQLDLLAQMAEVGRQDRRGDLQRHTSTSIDEPQCEHSVVAVLDIRTIVWCSPQPGQTDRSSKRCRQ